MSSKMRRLQPWFKQSMRFAARASALILVAPLVPAALYLAVAAIASRIPVNDDWREPDGGITIFARTNGVHTSVVVPANAAGVDWSNRIHPGELPDWSTAPRRLAFGWAPGTFFSTRRPGRSFRLCGV
jgi:hypothetical protein